MQSTKRTRPGTALVKSGATSESNLRYVDSTQIAEEVETPNVYEN